MNIQLFFIVLVPQEPSVHNHTSSKDQISIYLKSIGNVDSYIVTPHCSSQGNVINESASVSNEDGLIVISGLDYGVICSLDIVAVAGGLNSTSLQTEAFETPTSSTLVLPLYI